MAATMSALSLLGIIPHVIEDFDHGIPARFGVLTHVGAAALAIAITLQVLAMIGSCDDGTRRAWSLAALTAFGIAWALAAIIDHPTAFTTDAFRDGFPSRLAVWLIVATQLFAAAFALRALTSSPPTTIGAHHEHG